ncbi:MAG: sodium:proton antiporter NhaD [Rikenellaceae bacterium]|nr:sodium:proton antiporter NhaD [Rikenellaceae bacterium]
MILLMIAVFLIGYACIAMEHKLKIDKSAIALVLCGVLWVIYIFAAPSLIPSAAGFSFKQFLADNPSVAAMPYLEQCIQFVVGHQLLDNLGETAEILIFLIGAMTIVDLIDSHGGFSFITERITTRNERKLIWLIAGITFFMSALLDNMTTTIIMVMLLRKIIRNYKKRWIFAGVIIIAANSGGAWSPIGDVTTIMLWVKGNVSTTPLIGSLLLPCLVSALIPTAFAARMLKPGEMAAAQSAVVSSRPRYITKSDSLTILILGVSLLVCVPVFKTVTHLPPFMGVTTALGILWVYTELMYKHKRNMEESIKCRVSKVLKHIDMPTILFFLGILMSVAVLQSAGILSSFASLLDTHVHNIYAINLMIGLLSAVVDNVPLVAAAMGMYPVMDTVSLAAAADPAYMQAFVQDGTFWHLLAYCAGVGGSMLIIGSAAGVVAMGLEKMNFMWYFKRISLLAFMGYLAGAAVYVLQVFIGMA